MPISLFFLEICQFWTFFSFVEISLSFFGLQSEENPSKKKRDSPLISQSHLALLEVKQIAENVFFFLVIPAEFYFFL